MSCGRALIVAMVLLGSLALGGEAQAWESRSERRRRSSRATAKFIRENPCIAWPLIIGFAGLSIASKLQGRSFNFESRRRPVLSSDRHRWRDPIVAPAPRRLSGWDQLAAIDPTATTDQTRAFLTRLLERFQEAQGAGGPDPDALKAYASTRVLDQLRVAGSDHRARGRRIVDVSVVRLEPSEARARPDGALSFTLESELTYGVKGADGRVRRYEVRQQWRLDRQSAARALAPAAVRELGCPACGRAAEVKSDLRCSACDADVTPGRLAWRVTGVGIHGRKPVDGEAKLELRPEA